MLTETVPPPPAVDAEAFGVNHGLGNTQSTGTVIDSIIGSNLGGPPPSPPTVTRALRPSHMMEGNLIRRVQPEYPSLARQARIQGQVVLQAVISKQGAIENLRVLSGHPMLVRAAIEAVQQWRYRPYVLNGEPVEVETRVTVNFVLSGG
jgi:protein TonB